MSATFAGMELLYAMPGHLVRRAHQISTALFTEACAEYDLTSVQYAALHTIDLHPSIDATRLSALIAIDRSTVGDVLDRMEQKGWIVRRPAPGDRRIKLVALSDRGRVLLRRVEPSVRLVQERILAPLAPADRDRFVALLRELADVHNEVTPAPRRSDAITPGETST